MSNNTESDPELKSEDEHETEPAVVFTDDAPDAHPAEPEGPPPEDGKVERAIAFLEQLVSAMGVSVTVRLLTNTTRQIELDITGQDAAALIGKRGTILFALQFLTNRIVNRGPVGRRYVVLDVEGYRAKRERQLAAVAVKLGEKVAREGKIITFDPMSPRERRVVHLALAKFPGVRTQSEGEGDARRVQIIPTRTRTR